MLPRRFSWIRSTLWPNAGWLMATTASERPTPVRETGSAPNFANEMDPALTVNAGGCVRPVAELDWRALVLASPSAIAAWSIPVPPPVMTSWPALFNTTELPAASGVSLTRMTRLRKSPATGAFVAANLMAVGEG